MFEYGFSIFFGLIHGFGFGNYFEMLTDGLDTKITPLLGFAIGVELSQLVVVLAILLINLIVIKTKYFKEDKLYKHVLSFYHISIFKINLSNDLI